MVQDAAGPFALLAVWQDALTEWVAAAQVDFHSCPALCVVQLHHVVSVAVLLHSFSVSVCVLRAAWAVLDQCRAANVQTGLPCSDTSHHFSFRLRER
jgi:hypothetical protein